MRLKIALIVLLIIFTYGCANLEITPTELSDKKLAEKMAKCEEIKDKKSSDFCYIRKAIKENNETICLKINEKFSKDVCYMQLAAWYNTPKNCNKVVIEKEKDLCFFGMAIQLSDLSLCDKIREQTEINTDRGVCRKAAAIKNTKHNIRNDSLLDDDEILNIMYSTSDEIDRVLINELNKKTAKSTCGNGFCDLINNESINSCPQDCQKLDVLLQKRKPLDFFPNAILDFQIIPVKKEFFEYMGHYSEDEWLNWSYSYLEGGGNYITYQFIHENRTYWKWNKPPYEGGTATPIETIESKSETFKATYSKNTNLKGYSFVLEIIRYSDDNTYKIMKAKRQEGALEANRLRGNDTGYVDVAKEPLLDTEILIFFSTAYAQRFGGPEYEYLIFLPKINSVVKIHFDDSKLSYNETTYVVSAYLSYLVDKNSKFEIPK